VKCYLDFNKEDKNCYLNFYLEDIKKFLKVSINLVEDKATKKNEIRLEDFNLSNRVFLPIE